MAGVVGYRFHPTVYELLLHYLLIKTLGRESSIQEVKIYTYEPENLPAELKTGSGDDVFFAYCQLQKDPSTRLTTRTTPDGFWKPTGKVYEIKHEVEKLKQMFPEIKDAVEYYLEIIRRAPNSQQGLVTIGTKKTLVYHTKASRNQKLPPTGWVMHEFHLNTHYPNPSNLVLCKIKFKQPDGSADAVSLGKRKTRIPKAVDVADRKGKQKICEASDFEDGETSCVPTESNLVPCKIKFKQPDSSVDAVSLGKRKTRITKAVDVAGRKGKQKIYEAFDFEDGETSCVPPERNQQASRILGSSTSQGVLGDSLVTFVGSQQSQRSFGPSCSHDVPDNLSQENLNSIINPDGPLPLGDEIQNLNSLVTFVGSQQSQRSFGPSYSHGVPNNLVGQSRENSNSIINPDGPLPLGDEIQNLNSLVTFVGSQQSQRSFGPSYSPGVPNNLVGQSRENLNSIINPDGPLSLGDEIQNLNSLVTFVGSQQSQRSFGPSYSHGVLNNLAGQSRENLNSIINPDGPLPLGDEIQNLNSFVTFVGSQQSQRSFGPSYSPGVPNNLAGQSRENLNSIINPDCPLPLGDEIQNLNSLVTFVGSQQSQRSFGPSCNHGVPSNLAGQSRENLNSIINPDCPLPLGDEIQNLNSLVTFVGSQQSQRSFGPSCNHGVPSNLAGQSRENLNSIINPDCPLPLGDEIQNLNSLVNFPREIFEGGIENHEKEMVVAVGNQQSAAAPGSSGSHSVFSDSNQDNLSSIFHLDDAFPHPTDGFQSPNADTRLESHSLHDGIQATDGWIWESDVKRYKFTPSKSQCGVYVDSESDSDTDDEAIRATSATSFQASSSSTPCHRPLRLLTHPGGPLVDEITKIERLDENLLNNVEQEPQSSFSLTPSLGGKARDNTESDADSELLQKSVSKMLGTEGGTTSDSVDGESTASSSVGEFSSSSPIMTIDAQPTLRWLCFLVSLASLPVSYFASRVATFLAK